MSAMKTASLKTSDAVVYMPYFFLIYFLTK